MNLNVIIFLVLYAPIFHGLEYGEKRTINNWVDLLLLKAKLGLQDHIELPETEENLPLKAAGVKLEKGSLYDPSNVHRVGDAVIMRESPDGPRKAQVIFEFPNIQVVYDYAVKVTFFQIDSGRAVTSEDSVTVNVHLVFGENDCAVEVEKFDFLKFNDFKVELIPTTCIGGAISEVVVNEILNVFNTLIKEAVKQKMTEVIKEATSIYRRNCYDGLLPYSRRLHKKPVNSNKKFAKP